LFRRLLNGLILALTASALVLTGALCDDLWQRRTPNTFSDPRVPLYWYWNTNAAPRDVDPRLASATTDLIRFFDTGDRDALERARGLYHAVIPSLTVGTEYPALEWICEYFLASESEKSRLLANPEGARLLWYFSQSRFHELVQLLRVKVRLAPAASIGGLEGVRSAVQYLAFMRPSRADWEHTDQLMAAIDLKRGQHVADIGCGPGFHSLRFSDRVGDTGMVYAVETNPRHLEFLRVITEREKRTNIKRVLCPFDDVGIAANTLDCAFVCSLYHAIYGAMPSGLREPIIASLRRAIKPGGRFIICDNTPYVQNDSNYFGNRISRYLVEDHLSQYGFRLVRYYQLASQRYLLIFVRQ